MQGYKWVRWRVWLCRLTAVLSLGLILIIFHWRPRLGVLARCNSCPLGLADVLIITVKIIPIHMLGLFDRFHYSNFFFFQLLQARLWDIILLTSKTCQSNGDLFHAFFPFQDRFGQKHVVEVLKEELEEGRSASLHSSAHFLEGKEKSCWHIFFFLQLGFSRRTGRLWMERHHSAVQRWGQKELKLFAFYQTKNAEWNSWLLLQKTMLHYYLFEGMRYVWLVKRGTFCRVRY